MTAQLECNLCKTRRELTDEEIKESFEIINKRHLKPDAILSIWNVYDGETCPEGGMHEYDWDKDFFKKMLDDADAIRKNNAEMVRKTNENLVLENQVEQLKKDTEIKIKELTEKIAKNKETNIIIEKTNTELQDAILKASGREWRAWL